MKKSSPEKTTAWKPLRDNNSKTMRRLICISLIAAVCIVYMQTLGHEFTNFDDNIYVTKNDHVKAGLPGESVARGMPAMYKSGAWRNKAMAVSVGIIIPALMTVTWTQASHWQNSVALFKHAVAAVPSERPNFALVHLNLGKP